MKKNPVILIPLLIIFLIDLFSVRAVYQNCTCPELYLIDPVESALLKWKYRDEPAVRTNEIYSEKDLAPDGPRPAFTTMTLFGYYIQPKCEDTSCTVQNPQFRILFSVPTLLLIVLETIFFLSVFFAFRKKPG